MTANVSELSERVEVLLDRLEPRPDAHELVRTLVTLYGEALSRIFTAVRETPDGERIVQSLAADAFVASVMIVHDLHPVSLQTRIARALDDVRPYLRSHGGDVDVVGIADGVVELQLRGTCDGCPSSSATLKLAVERAILTAAPEIAEVRANTAAPAAAGARDLPSVSTWTTLESVHDLAPNSLHVVNIDGVALLLVRGPEALYAYYNRCAGCAHALHDGALTWPLLRCARCAETYDIERAGRSPSSAAHLEPLPLVTGDGHARVAVPASA